MVNKDAIRTALCIVCSVILFLSILSPTPPFHEKDAVEDLSPRPYFTIRNCALLFITINGIRLVIEFIYAVFYPLYVGKKRQSYFAQKKLCLVLDLDHTLLHSVNINDVSNDEQKYLNSRVSSVGSSLYKHDRMGKYIKLRPYTREFLKEASGMFILFIYTMASRQYAQEIGKLLDPNGVLFNNNINIVSREDSTIINKKNLDVMAGPYEKNTIIIDDTEHVWAEHGENLIRIDRYMYFSAVDGSYKLKKDGGEGCVDEDEALKSISEVLHCVHKMFFESFPVPQAYHELQEYAKTVDVRPILKESRNNSGKGAPNC
ncbi:hypothetical protein MKW94_011781 [Papaver nudicaule]|uniref:RNA polymerase II C-terminal domain phosphatase-like n=1 Tax=Papaver nudicaule TaxID=74823 RepID=A0AA41S8B5_PAPNU|nr:hypothetical protein [Papaver nudicaule]